MTKDSTVKTKVGESLILESDPDLFLIQIDNLASPLERFINGQVHSHPHELCLLR